MKPYGYRSRNERIADEQGRSVVKAAEAGADSVALLKSINTKLQVSNLLAVTTNEMFSIEDREAAFDEARKALFDGRK